MNKFLYFLFIIPFIGCKSEINKNYYSTEKNDIEFIEFRLPELEKWKECHSDNNVADHFNSFLTMDKFEIVGIYLTNETYLKKDSLDLIDFEDYAVFMINVNEQKWKLSGSDLDRIFKIQKEQKNIESVKKEIALSKAFSDTTFFTSDKPVIIEEYKPDENILSAVKLVKPYPDYHDFVVVYVFNLININNHLIYASYYQDLKGNESIQEVKNKSDEIMKAFVELNE